MWGLDCEEGWEPKNWCFWTVVLEKTLESPLDCKEIQPVHSKEDQSWVFIGRSDAKADTPILLPPHVKSWLIGKDPDAGRYGGQEEKGTTEDETAGWHHRLDGRESGWTLGVGDGTGRPGVLWFMGSQRVGHDWATELTDRKEWMWDSCTEKNRCSVFQCRFSLALVSLQSIYAYLCRVFGDTSIFWWKTARIEENPQFVLYHKLLWRFYYHLRSSYTDYVPPSRWCLYQMYWSPDFENSA